jgi:exopolyphosphatase / guanosine-5'-triphosphate,3'-diphosphate pyrophosphatase
MRIAVIDLGTNTFNLLVAETDPVVGYRVIFNEKIGVKLGKGGINNNEILPDAMQRGFNALATHASTIQLLGAEKVYAIGTSALRDASNAQLFATEIQKRFGFNLEIISGTDEANYIYKGVCQSLQQMPDNFIILDIGGGSNEFIISEKGKVCWMYSYNLGMARLLEKFKPSDPIKIKEIEAMEAYFEQEMSGLFEAVKTYKPSVLVGASGTFDSIRAILNGGNTNFYHSAPSVEIPLEKYLALHQKLIASDLEQRKQMPGLEPVRWEMIVPASIFVTFTLHHLEIKELWQSSYSLKEGVVASKLKLI